MKKRGKTGKLWMDERYDRIVRDEAEFLEKWSYIRNNPVKAGLATNPEDYPWLYEKGKTTNTGETPVPPAESAY